MGKSIKYAIEPTNNRKAKRDKEQHSKFIEAAREHECDEDEAVFDEKLKKVAKPEKPKD